MIKTRNLAALLALSGVAVLPACSMFGGDSSSSRSSRASYSSQGYASAPNYNSTSQVGPELTPDMIRNVQQALQQDGTYRGRVDGVWGAGTQAAVRTYQQQHNMNATGQLDQDTLAAMNLGAAPNNAQQQPDSQRYGSNRAPNYNPPPNDNPYPPNTNATR